ncbi:hypothetical protein VZT92_000132 [Zoarces viviparus]|uniref:REJ domain-containing protein n=1 Tax=Zoarces viviparus TaxID=48416 RepID=A0AAW1G516_ZOAVI
MKRDEVLLFLSPLRASPTLSFHPSLASLSLSSSSSSSSLLFSSSGGSVNSSVGSSSVTQHGNDTHET